MRNTEGLTARIRSRLLCGGVSIAVIGLLTQPNVVFAQTAPATSPSPAASSNAQTVEQVIVTGSRIQTAGFTTPTPVTVVSSDQLEATAPLISEGLDQLPSMTVGSQRTGGIGTGGSGQAIINMRNLGATRTLVLLDGRRFTPTAADGTVDISQMPNALIQRVDIVTGGASAQYGSDAVAGVVNFILNEKFEGVKASIEGGISDYADVPETQASVAAGTAFGPSDRGHVLFSVEAYSSTGISNADRPYANDGAALITNPCPIGAAVSATCPTGTNGMPQNLRETNVRITTAAPGGLIIGGPLGGTTFDVGGTPRPFQYGTLTTVGTTVGGEGYYSQLGPTTSIVGDLNRFNTFGRASYDITDDLNVFTELSYSVSHNKNDSGIPFAVGGAAFKITQNNAYLPAAIKADMIADNLSSITVGKLLTEFPDRPPVTDDTLYRGMVGSDFTLWGWKGEAFVQHGLNKRLQTQPDQEDQIAAFQAVNAVVVPAGTPGLVAGTIACQSTLTNPTNGCIPLDIFGPGAASPAAIAAITAKTPRSLLTYTQDVASFSMSGPVLEEWAGTISAAFGGEYRKEALNNVSDPYSQVANPISGSFGGYLAGSQLPYRGEENVKEGFLEVDVPLAHDMTLLQDASLNGAIRYTDYSISGDVTTWKAGALYNPFESLRFRYTRSRDIRSPTLTQFFQAGASGTTNLIDPGQNGATASGVKTITSGNLNLVPEVANTEVMGFVYTPDWLDGFNVSVDRYTINIKNAITSIPNQTILNGCYGIGVPANPSFCSLLTRNSAGVLTAIVAAPVNATSLVDSGVDFEADWNNNIPTFVPYFGDGNFHLRGLTSYVGHLITTAPGSAPIDGAGEDSGVNTDAPHWKGLVSLTLQQQSLSWLLQSRFISAGSYDVTKIQGAAGVAGINDNHVAGVGYLDTRVSYHFPVQTGDLELYLSVDNLLNRTPPVTGTTGSSPAFTNDILYDVVGRYFRMGVNIAY